jgi:hypothetical protein
MAAISPFIAIAIYRIANAGSRRLDKLPSRFIACEERVFYRLMKRHLRRTQSVDRFIAAARDSSPR